MYRIRRVQDPKHSHEPQQSKPNTADMEFRKFMECDDGNDSGQYSMMEEQIISGDLKEMANISLLPPHALSTVKEHSNESCDDSLEHRIKQLSIGNRDESNRCESGYSSCRSASDSGHYSRDSVCDSYNSKDDISDFGSRDSARNSAKSVPGFTHHRDTSITQERDNTTHGSSDQLIVYLTWEQIVALYRWDDEGDNKLHLSIIDGHTNLSIHLINLAPHFEWLCEANLLGQTPMHLAVLTRQPAVVRRLITAGATVDDQDRNGDTPLHIACRKGYPDVVRELITPVKHHETKNNKYIIPFQRMPQNLGTRNCEGLTCLHVAAEFGHMRIVQMLLGAGADINAGDDKSGRTLLHNAAEMNNVELVRWLLSRNDVSIDKRTYGGSTAVSLAYGRHHIEIVNLFLEVFDNNDKLRDDDYSDALCSSSSDDMSDDSDACS